MATTPVFCPVCGERLGRALFGGRQRPACENCGYVHYVNPVPGVGLLIEMDGGLVLIRRGHAPHKGEWTLPSGFVEADESAEEAAVREAEEETGLKTRIINLASVISFPEGPPTSGIMIFFRLAPVGGTLRAGDDAAEARVFAPREMPLIPFRTHREVVAAWLEQQAHPAASPATLPLVGAPDVMIRLADADDLGELFALMALIPANRALPQAARASVVQRFRETPGLEVYVAQTRQQPATILGFIALSVVRSLTEGMGIINDMAVLPTYQRRGVGAALLEAVMRRARHLGLASLVVNAARANDSARAFYAGTGFGPGQFQVLRLHEATPPPPDGTITPATDAKDSATP